MLHSPLAEAFWAPQGGNYGKLICASMCHDSCKKPIAEKRAANDKAGKLDVTLYSYYTNSAKECVKSDKRCHIQIMLSFRLKLLKKDFHKK